MILSAIEQLQAILFAGFAVFVRVAAAMQFLPSFSSRAVPMRIRLVAAIFLTVLILPLIYADLQVFSLTVDHGLRLLFSETLAGLTFGFAFYVMVSTLQIVGTMAAQSTSLAQIFGTAGVEPMPAIGHLLMVSGLALIAISGFHTDIIGAFLISYEVWPAGVFVSGAELSDWAVSLVARGFGAAFSLAAPFVIASLIYNVALGVINKAMPQLMVAFVGAPAITAGGLILLALATPFILQVWWTVFSALLHQPFLVPR